MTELPQRHSSEFRFSLRATLVAFVMASVIFTFIRLGMNASERAKRYSTTNEFRQIGFALLTWIDGFDRLPHSVRYADGLDKSHVDLQDPNAKPLYSWRFALAPSIASYKLDAAFDQPWNSPANAQWRVVSQPFAYEGWGSGVLDRRPPNRIPTNTAAFAITGPGTAFGDPEAESIPSLDGIDDDTILVVEIRDSRIHWMQPGDFDIRKMPRTINDPTGHGISSQHEFGFHVIFADATVWFLDNEVPFDELAKFFTLVGAKENDRDELLAPYRLD